jgi:hypothetical protein
MARTAVVPAKAVRNGGVAVTPTTINSGLVTAGVTVAAPANLDKFLLRVSNTDTSPHNLIMRAGTDLNPAWMAGQGDAALAVAASATEYFGPFDSARFLQADNSASIDFSTGMAGTLEIVQLP